MAPERRNQIVLAVLVVALVGMIYGLLPATTGPSPSGPGATAANGAAPVTAQSKATNVRLAALEAERPKPSDSDRNLFRFKPRPAPALPRIDTPTAVVRAPTVPAGPPPPPAVPPITLKFIGIVEAPERALKVAVLSDALGVYYGREGETVLGQYRIIRIGAESLDISYVDGRGRQTIRLNGS